MPFGSWETLFERAAARLRDVLGRVAAEVLPDRVAKGAGADAVAMEEGKKGFEIDIEAMAEVAAGRCTILGNLGYY